MSNQYICLEDCCQGKLAAPPPRCHRPCCAPRYDGLVELKSADGFIFPKLLTVPHSSTEYRTLIHTARPYVRSEVDDPTAAGDFTFRLYQWRGQTRFDPQSNTEVRIFEERLPEPPPAPKYRVCESARSQWCNGCRTTHKSVAPRIVSGK